MIYLKQNQFYQSQTSYIFPNPSVERRKQVRSVPLTMINKTSEPQASNISKPKQYQLNLHNSSKEPITTNILLSLSRSQIRNILYRSKEKKIKMNRKDPDLIEKLDRPNWQKTFIRMRTEEKPSLNLRKN